MVVSQEQVFKTHCVASDLGKRLMDLIIILFWFAVSVAILIGIISSSYYVHVRGVDDLTLVSKIVFALIVYGLLAFGTGSLAGFGVYVGATLSLEVPY